MILLLSIAARADVPDWSVVPLESVQPDPDAAGEVPVVAAAVSRVSAEIRPGAESRLTLTYTIQTFADGFSVASLGAGPLTVESARLDGRAVAVPPERGGDRRLVAELPRGTHTVVLAGVMTTPLSTLSLPMPLAPIEVAIEGEGLDVSVDRGAALSAGRLVVPPGPALSVAWKPAAPPAPRPSRLEASAAVGLTLSTDGMEGAGVVTFDAIRGAVDRVRIAVPGADWAEASGGVVASSTLSGGWLEVALVEPQTGRFSVDVALRGPAGEGRTDAPLLLPQADSREGWVSIYQGEEGYLARDATDLEVISPGAVPQWGRDLASGQLLSSLHYTTGRPSLRWEQSEWEALQTPGTVIDSAQYEVAVVAHGRALTRARYQVRNDRGAWLWMDLPESSSVLTVRVAGHIVEPVHSGGRLGIPLEKSVETLTGLVSFPVEVATLAPAPEFSRRGRATLTVPAVSAPVTDATWTLYLPPGTTTRRTEGNVQVAAEDAPERELLIGRGYRKEPPMISASSGSFSADKKSEEASQDYWNQAYDAYKDNRFDEAGELLEQSLIYNPDNSAASALQGNVMVLTGESDSDGEAEQVERVKAMARAKSKGESQRQQVLVDDAEEQLRAGNVEEAIALYEDAIEVTDQLARLESDEAYVQKAVAEDLRGRLAEAEVVSSRNRRQEESERRREEEQRQSRQRASFAQLEGRIASLQGSRSRYGGCYAMIETGTVEMMDMVLEQAWMVISAEEIDMAADILMFMDDLQRQISALSPECEAELSGQLGSIEEEVEELKEQVFRSASTLSLSREMILDGSEIIEEEPEWEEGELARITSDEIVYRNVTEIDFEGIEVSGELVRPEVALLVEPEPEPAPPPADSGEVLTRDFLQRIPTGRSYQAAVQMAAGVTGGSNPNVGGAAGGDGFDEDVFADEDDDFSFEAPVMAMDSDTRGSRRSRDRRGDRSLPVNDPVQTVSAFDVPTGVTASRWIVLVPSSGPMLEFTRQLVPAGEVLEVVVPYRIDSRGRQGG